MTRKLFTTLAVALLGLIATKAQQPFTGRVEYEFIFKIDNRERPIRMMMVEYGNKYMKIMPMPSKDSTMAEYEIEVVLDYASKQLYQLMHAAKKVIIQDIDILGKNFVPTFSLVPGMQTTLAGIKASLYEIKENGTQSYDVWLSDSLAVAVSDVVAKNSDFFIFGTGKLMLKTAPKPIQVLKGQLQDMTINAVKITPLTFSDSNYQLPADYTVEDESALRRMQDSLMQQFKNVDSMLAQQLNTDSAKWVADQINGTTNKKAASPKKPAKKGAAKVNKPTARRPKQ
jgi:hypothetical protein